MTKCSSQTWLVQIMSVVTMLIFASLFPSVILAELVDGESEVDLETSIVSLVIQTEKEIVENDYFFELLDMGDYLLLPLGSLSSRLEILVNFNREEGILTVKSPVSGKMVQVDVENQLYLEHPTWSQEPPVLFNGDFYVTTLLLENLIEAKLDWNTRIQELTITVKSKNDLESGDGSEGIVTDGLQSREKNSTENATEAVGVGATLNPTVIGEDFSLGSIQYRVSFGARKKANQPVIIQDTEEISLHGRYKDWSISLGGGRSHDYSTGETHYSLPLLKAEYRKDDIFFGLGDTEINLQQTLGQQELRGLLFRYPESQTKKVLALTTVSGAATPGDQVILYINGFLLAEQVVTEGDSYQFPHVPLEIHRTNTIRVVIQGENGEEREVIKQVAASPRILEEGTREFLLAMGLYREFSTDNWTGQMMGAELHQALNQEVTLNWELAVSRSVLRNDHEPSRVGSILGIAARAQQPLIFTLDWLIGGVDEQITVGGKSSLLYTFGSGYLKGAYFYIPPEIMTTIQETAGKKFQALAEMSFDKILLRFQGDLFSSGWDMSPEQKETAQLSVFYQKDPWRYTSLTGNLGRQSLLNLETEEDSETVVIKDGGVSLEHRSEGFGTSINGKLSLSAANLSIAQEPSIRVKQIEFEGGYYKKINSLVLANNLEFFETCQEGETENSLMLESRIKWNGKDDLYLSGIGKVTGSSGSNADSKFGINETEFGLLLQKYFSHRTSLFVDGTLTKLPFLDEAYSKCSVGWNHFFGLGGDSVALSVGYLSSVQRREVPQWTSTIELIKYLDSNIKLSLKAQRLYDNIYEEEPEQILTFSISQGLGLARDHILGQRYSEKKEHHPYIGGVVFLDENGNGRLEEGEPQLPGIQMFLDGRRAKSDQEGRFHFEGVHSGVYEVGFDLNSLVADYTVVTPNKIVQIRENENLFLQFGLTMNGSISGKAFIDKNANGIRDQGEEVLPWVAIEISEKGKTAFSQKDGSFYLGNIPLGKYTIRVLEDSLPAGMVVADCFQSQVILSKDQLDLKEIEIPVVFDF